jgi:wyosine [tRNA(Phe)-imidazoG37] synthetase (radical SAM superfamily)
MQTTLISSVYGPVKSWRYGRSLGIDPIGSISTCSFNCVYCQLGEIEQLCQTRKIYVATSKILQDLRRFAPWDVDALTLSGSGEPTLALNLAEILTQVKELTQRPTIVLTNGTLLFDSAVRAALCFADKVSIKIDAVSDDQLRRINRPLGEIQLSKLWSDVEKFRAEYDGELSIQTMMLSHWKPEFKQAYIRLMQLLRPAEIHLNTPTRPKPVQHQLEARGNHSLDNIPYAVKVLKGVNSEILYNFAREIQAGTGIPVRCAPV